VYACCFFSDCVTLIYFNHINKIKTDSTDNDLTFHKYCYYIIYYKYSYSLLLCVIIIYSYGMYCFCKQIQRLSNNTSYPKTIHINSKDYNGNNIIKNECKLLQQNDNVYIKLAHLLKYGKTYISKTSRICKRM